uniref:LOW QUALITY PROTEIN: fibrous sheath CABYR-binding protein-like n=1 Tax=Drosophila rhopaloa TaxID=1041015 RepID=A0A6P4F7E6_DRORH
MAKKGGQQQLQADLQTDEDLERFMERPGLLVLDVYSEWCGPCLGMVGSLRKIKLEIGGDNLHLAICKSDTITSLKRFNKRSEPIWLFVTGGRAVNIMFGSDVPKMISLLTKELEKVVQKAPRPIAYRMDELQPIEVEQLRVKMEAIERAERAEFEVKHKKQMDYLTQVTDSIMENMPDIGVTVFGPQVNRDMFKKLTEPAEPLKMQCKDRRVIQVTSDQFEVVNFGCKNPLPPDVIEQLDGKELLMCFWKIDESIGTVPNVLMAYAHELTRERVAPPNDEILEEHVIPPIIATMKLKIEIELKEGEVWVEEVSSEEEQRLLQAKAKGKTKSVVHEEVHPAEEEAGDLDAEEEASEEEAPEPAGDAMGGFPSIPGFDMEMDGGDEIAEDEEEVQEVKEEEPPKPLTRTKTVKVPPIWVPNNRRTHAALIYVFFRGQTSGFLPPDPKPEPPHVIMAFDASKRKEIMHVVDRHKDDVPLYGYFSSAEPDEAELIANSTDKYEGSPHSANDKIVLKVNKAQSNMMLSLVSYGPSYVSPNVNVGKDEALKFFPEDYKPQEEVVVEPEKKKKKSKKGSEIRESVDAESITAASATAPAAPAPASAPAPADAPGTVEGEAPAAEEEVPAADVAVAPAEGAPAAEGEAVAATEPGAAEAPVEAPAPPAAPPAAPEAAPEAPKEEAPAPEAPEPEEEAPAPEAPEPEAPAEPAPEPPAE